MIHDNAVVGAPLTLYKDTKANIEALSLTEGDKFWATDIDIEGYYDGSNIIWRPDNAGWVYDAVTWTYASTTTFTVSGDQTAIFAKGTKIKLTQTTVKYFYVTASSYSSPNTTVTITGGSDYTLANAAITNPAYSYASPPDFPEWFSYSVSWTATTNPAIGNGSLIGRFSISGKTATCIIRMAAGSTTTFGSGNWSFSLPVQSSNYSAGVVWAIDQGTYTFGGFVYIGTSQNNFNIAGYKDGVFWRNTQPITWASSDEFISNISYEY